MIAAPPNVATMRCILVKRGATGATPCEFGLNDDMPAQTTDGNVARPANATTATHHAQGIVSTSSPSFLSESSCLSHVETSSSPRRLPLRYPRSERGPTRSRHRRSLFLKPHP